MAMWSRESLLARLLTVPYRSDEQMPAVQGQTDGRARVALAVPTEPNAKPAAVREVCGKINEHCRGQNNRLSQTPRTAYTGQALKSDVYHVLSLLGS
ncbi:hypothetical protein SRHO_G00207910 [Serrasalmus rhombeus]